MLKTYYLKNMVSMSCIRLITLSLERLKGIRVQRIVIGEVVLDHDHSEQTEKEVEHTFRSIGFEIIQDPDSIIVERIKQAAIELIFYAYNANSLIRNSDYISQKLQLPYDRLSKVFSKVTGTTLEKYIILLKIEKAKDMLTGNEFTVSEISFMLGYSSVHYLSTQFKKVTGITISKFKENPSLYRTPIEDLAR